MTDAPDRLTPATPDDLADALAFALRFDGRRRKHDAAEMMAAIVARRLVEHLERVGICRHEAAGDRRLGAGLPRRGTVVRPDQCVEARGIIANRLAVGRWPTLTHHLRCEAIKLGDVDEEILRAIARRYNVSAATISRLT